MRKVILKKIISKILMVGVFLPGLTLAQSWDFQIEPYVQATSIEGDSGMGRITGAPLDVGFDDILENLDAAAMVHFEALHESGWGLALDYGFMDLKADITGSSGGILDAQVRQGVLEGLLFKSNNFEDARLDAFVGLRWWDNDIDVRVDPAVLPGTLTTNVKEDWVDVVIGVRFRNSINQKWGYALRADMGGMGVESSFTLTLSTGLFYQMTENWILDLQYKATWVDYENGIIGAPGYYAYDTVTHGPLLGVIYSF